MEHDRPGTLQHLSADRLRAGAAVLVNHPTHDGDTPLHDHDFAEFAVIQAGRAVHRSVYGEEPVEAGDVFVLHPGQWHAYERCRGLELMNCCLGLPLLAGELAWTRTDPLLAPLLPRPGGAGQVIRRLRLPEGVRREVREHLLEIRRLQTGRQAVLDRHAVIARTLLVLGHLGRAAVTKGAASAVEDPPPAVVQAQDLMAAQLDHVWGLEELSRRTGVSRFHLARSFRAALGAPPMAWLARRRMERAAVLLLTTDQAIADIGRQVGWPDANFFTRRFRATFGETPSAYRRALPMPALPASEGEAWVQW